MGREHRKLGPYHTFKGCKFHSEPPKMYEIQFMFEDGIKSNDDGDHHFGFQKLDSNKMYGCFASM